MCKYVYAVVKVKTSFVIPSFFVVDIHCSLIVGTISWLSFGTCGISGIL